jgi:alkanesulfonate monooxygenase SsuD/methylene tetrahydromethanopterin reductase-like flavin-dependent oxidoreductase (luciferase family)
VDGALATSELCPQIVGTPESVADQLQELFEEHACETASS